MRTMVRLTLANAISFFLLWIDELEIIPSGSLFWKEIQKKYQLFEKVKMKKLSYQNFGGENN